MSEEKREDASGRRVRAEPSQEFYANIERAQPFFRDAKAAAGFDLPPATWAFFRRVHERIIEDPPRVALAHLTGTTWKQRFIERTLDNVQEGLAGCHFHVQAIEEIERRVRSALESHRIELNEFTINHAIGGGNTRRLNFEYHAFIFAGRRTMEYFAGAISAYFKDSAYRIRVLPTVLERGKPKEKAARAAQVVLPALADLLDFIPPEDAPRSVRDELTHHKTISGGHTEFAVAARWSAPAIRGRG